MARNFIAVLAAYCLLLVSFVQAVTEFIEQGQDGMMIVDRSKITSVEQAMAVEDLMRQRRLAGTHLRQLDVPISKAFGRKNDRKDICPNWGDDGETSCGYCNKFKPDAIAHAPVQKPFHSLKVDCEKSGKILIYCDDWSCMGKPEAYDWLCFSYDKKDYFVCCGDACNHHK